MTEKTNLSFWCGTTSSSLQAEGVAPAADWSRWERSGRVPLSGDGNGIATNYKDDFALLASLGLSHIRIGLEWARLEPKPGKIDSAAFDLYQDILTSARRSGLLTLATLHHGTLPGWFSEDTAGYLDSTHRERTWVSHVERCAERYDELVDIWVPIEDPIGWAIRGFLLGSRPPGNRDAKLAAKAAEGAILANHAACSVLRGGNTPIMATFGVPTIFNHGPDSEKQRKRWHKLLFNTWISALRDGELLVPGLPPRELSNLTGAFDLIGLGHDHPIAIDHKDQLHPYPNKDRRTDTGFTPIVKELGEVISFVAAELPSHQIVVSSHGVSTADDEWREEIVNEALDLISDVSNQRIPVIGYLHDTGIDGYEGPLGFSTQRGVISRQRELKGSALSLKRRLN